MIEDRVIRDHRKTDTLGKCLKRGVDATDHEEAPCRTCAYAS